MAGSHTPASEHHTSVDSSPLTLVSTVEHGLSERLAGRVDGHLAACAEHMREGLLAASTAVSLEVMAELIDVEVCEIAGAKGKHDIDRTAVRHGTEAGSVTLGGRRVPVRRPRVRTVASDDEPAREVPLETYATFAAGDLLAEGILARMLAGISTRRYPVALEPSAHRLSRRHRRRRSRRCPAASSTRPPTGSPSCTPDDSTSGADLAARGLDATRGILFVIDGGKAIAKAVDDVFGDLAVNQRCRRHKEATSWTHLPEDERHSCNASCVRRGQGIGCRGPRGPRHVGA